MKWKKFFNTTQKEVEERKYNILVGISLGVLKPLTKETAKEYIEWALKNTKNKVTDLTGVVEDLNGNGVDDGKE